VKQVKQTELLKIAALVAVLVTLPVTISLFGINPLVSEHTPQYSPFDLVLRLLFVFVFSYLVLQFNTNWKYRLYHFHQKVNTFLVVIINIALYFASVIAIITIYPLLIENEPYTGSGRFFFFIFSVIHIILLFIARILRLGVIRQESLLENERLQQQNLQKELSALRNQLNPHFLFNSLNTLNSLIRDNNEATMFVNKLSHMYRYILQSGERDLVCLKDELQFLESYTYLIEMRYHQFCFKIDLDIRPEHLHMELPPMALQLLVENAVKHNEISKGCPLEVKIYSKEDFLVVENKIHPRNSPVDSTGNGLINLDKRYFLLRKKRIRISSDETTFSVKLPLISSV
jgi:LytS/YehU family sensor histidine kinase